MLKPYSSLASVYDALIDKRFFPQLRRAFAWLTALYGIRFDAVADVACGTGTFVRHLCQCRVPLVYGADRSREMLGLAMRKNAGNHAQFLWQDFSTLLLPQPMKLLTCNFDSLNYLLEPRQLLCALQRFYMNLAPGGHFVFDVISNPLYLQGPKPWVEEVKRPGFCFRRVMQWSPRSGLQVAVITIEQNGRLQEEVHHQRAYPIATVTRLLRCARFEVLGAHDFHALFPATRWSSRVAFVVRKPE
jgi:SAM-dependent methyltransferase